jgi:hypothetical protein
VKYQIKYFAEQENILNFWSQYNVKSINLFLKKLVENFIFIKIVNWLINEHIKNEYFKNDKYLL